MKNRIRSLYSWGGEFTVDFEKSTFLHREAIFHSVRELQRGLKWPFLTWAIFFEEHLKNFKSVENSKKKIEFCKKVSKVSVDSFMVV